MKDASTECFFVGVSIYWLPTKDNLNVSFGESNKQTAINI